MMTEENIPQLEDREIIEVLMERYKLEKLKDFAIKVKIPFATMNKWKCDKGIPTKIPASGAYRQLFEALLLIEIRDEQLDKFKNYFKLKKEIEESLD